ncbi:hypothetical protein [Actinophytocola sediminis]
MKAELRAFMSFDVDDLSSWAPEVDEWAVGCESLLALLMAQAKSRSI